MLESTHLNGWASRNADITHMRVVTVFMIYTLLSGSALFLFRLSRRSVAIFTSTVVAAACVAAVIPGGVLRTRQGVLRWVTVTGAGPGGLLQLGKIDVQSVGGRNTQVTVESMVETEEAEEIWFSRGTRLPSNHYYPGLRPKVRRASG